MREADHAGVQLGGGGSVVTLQQEVSYQELHFFFFFFFNLSCRFQRRKTQKQQSSVRSREPDSGCWRSVQQKRNLIGRFYFSYQDPGICSLCVKIRIPAAKRLSWVFCFFSRSALLVGGCQSAACCPVLVITDFSRSSRWVERTAFRTRGWLRSEPCSLTGRRLGQLLPGHNLRCSFPDSRGLSLEPGVL